jgi:transposase
LVNNKIIKKKANREHVTPNSISPKIIINALPAYAPILNLIERLWRFVKGQLAINRYSEKYKIFRAKVFKLLNNLDNCTDKLKTLITDNFEIVPQKECQEKPKSHYYSVINEVLS